MIRAGLVKWLRDSDAVRAYHWLTEFQASGRPHLHCLVVATGPAVAVDLVRYWLRRVGHTGALDRGQWVEVVRDSGVAWLVYCGRHGARGLGHAQRAGREWLGGRMWGRGGAWVLHAVSEVLCRRQYFRFRRLLRGYLRSRLAVEIAAALTIRNGRKRRRRLSALIPAARRAKAMLRGPDRKVSTVAGVSVWLPVVVSEGLIDAARAPDFCSGCDWLRFRSCETGSSVAVRWRGLPAGDGGGGLGAGGVVDG